MRDARRRAGYESAQAAAEAFGWKAAAYRHHENGTRAYDPDSARRYARAFKVDPAWLLGLATTNPPAHVRQGEELVEVIGAVAAGVWRESREWEGEKRFTISVGPSLFPGARRFALEVEGHSMDREFPPGTLLDCVSIYDVGLEPANDDYVVVERRSADGRYEITVKKYHVDDQGRKWLLPESTRPEFQAPIELGVEEGEEDQVEVIAFVVGDYTPRASRLLKRSQEIVDPEDPDDPD